MTSIEWTDETWNPATGCTKISAGCKNCYAETIAKRFWGDRKFTDVEFHPERLKKPLTWRKPRMVFVNSMSDLFHEDLTNEQIAAVFGVMAATPKHTFQVLTKRPERMLEWFEWVRQAPHEVEGEIFAFLRCSHQLSYARGQPPNDEIDVPEHPWPLPNVWLGVSVEDQKSADDRILLLLQAPAAVRFVSYEPALAAVNMRGLLLSSDRPAACKCGHGHSFNRCPNYGSVSRSCHIHGCDCTAFIRRLGEGIHWAIVGGESGPRARPMDVEWARSVVAQCKDAGVACFVKQLGARPVRNDGVEQIWQKLASKKGGDPSEWPEDLRVREIPQVTT